MVDKVLYARGAQTRLEEALADTPVVLVHGPRQCGKTTLARLVGDARGYAYVSFDDDVALAAAKADPVGFVIDLPDKAVLDEVQRAPGLFTAIKTAVDRLRTPGRFILTGSANILLVPKLADSLAGRMEILRLHPLAQCELAAGQTARLVNVAEMAGPFQLSRPTIRDYVTLLERVFLLESLPPWHSNRLSRLIKTPKLHLGDTGLATTLLNLDPSALLKDRAMLGQLLETFVFQELRRQASWHEADISFHHFRDKDGAEVDIVLERGAQELAGIEVKTAATVISNDFRGLRKLKETAGKRFAAGVVLYDGESAVGFGDSLFAVPIRALWETT